MSYKIIVAHPGKQHSFYLAEALEKAGMLEAYVTTVYNADHSITRAVGKFLRGDNKKRFITRKNDVFDKKVVQTAELRGLLFLLFLRIPGFSRARIWLQNDIHRVTYKKAIYLAKQRNADAVVFYGRFQKEHKEYVNKIFPNLKCIIDVPTATAEYTRDCFDQDIVISGDSSLRTEMPDYWDNSFVDSVHYWANHADGYLAGSTVVKKSLEYVGTRPDRIRVVHYGADSGCFSQKEYCSSDDGITFIFVGTFYRRKGIHHLLHAFERLGDSKKARLLIVGAYKKNDPLYMKYRDRKDIQFYGFVTKDKMPELYRQADVFVFPSLMEGMAQVGIEAMSSGLPIICTENSGTNDLVNDGINGFVIKTSNEYELFEKMNWFADHKDEIPRMGDEARKTALKNTWDSYEENVCKAIIELLDNAYQESINE